jgi:DNA-binding winged helix-turn-helix (wHTH) protein/tetratricopeptide (TPR) repeat protein
MESASEIRFGPYRLEQDGARLWKEERPVPIQPRPLAVLRYLATRPGAVIGRDELLAALWSGTHVTRAVLKVAVRALREALEEDAESPRYIETVGRSGYRFIGSDSPPSLAVTIARPVAPTEAIVGRAAELAALRLDLEDASSGARQITFVTGEAGIGKTTLIDRFVRDVARGPLARVARGQCLEHYGEGEAYLPVLEAIGGLALADDGAELASLLRRRAPSWLAALPALRTDGALPPRGTESLATKSARMLREMADALEAYTRGRSLVLVLEDLQWSDPSTVDLIAYLAQRRQRARLLVIGTFRSPEVIVHDHPLRAVKQGLAARGQCRQIALEPLSLDDVRTYVDARFASASEEMRSLATRVHERTEGNALFMVNMLNDLLARERLVLRDGGWEVTGSIEQATDCVPSGLQELIGRRMACLAPATHRTLEVASVAGDEFTVASVAAAAGEDADGVEESCELLAAQEMLIADTGLAEWPDGSITGRYRFRHALYRRALYEGIGESRRARLHRAIGLREEAAFGDRVGEHAARLAMHFSRGRDHARALRYHELAGRAAVERHAAHEAVSHFEAALDALGHESANVESRARELELVLAIGRLVMATRGYAAPETERAFARARSLCEESPASAALSPVLRGLVSYHHVRAELAQGRELGELLLRHAAEQPHDPVLRVQAHYGHGATLFHHGELDAARGHFELALAEYDPATHREHALAYGGYDPGVACALWLAWTLALMGRLDEAVARGRAGLELALRLDDQFSLAWAHHATGVSHLVVGDWKASEAASAEAMRLAEEHGFPHTLAMATANRGWALLKSGRAAMGIALLREGIAAVAATGAALVRPQYLGMLAAADAIEGHPEAALRHFDEGLAEIERTGERVHEVGLLIGKSRLLAAGSPGARRDPSAEEAAEACLRRAIEVARGQGAQLLELRATVALARHEQGRGHVDEARGLLGAAHAHRSENLRAARGPR